MKRDSIALIVRPYKNNLVAPSDYKKYIDTFAEKLSTIMRKHPNLRANIALPGYMLSALDPMRLTALNEIKKARCLEWLMTGQTEPFIGFSPLWLSSENIRQGAETFKLLTGEAPLGFLPPFSNWEPSFIDSLNENGIAYTVISRSLFSEEFRKKHCYWISEHLGSFMTVFPSVAVHPSNAPANILKWIDKQVVEDSSDNRLLTIDYLVPLDPGDDDPFEWIDLFAEKLDTILVKYRMLLFSETANSIAPGGVQVIPQGMFLNRGDEEVVSEYANYLHRFNSIGLIQRKMLNISEKVNALSDSKEKDGYLKKLFEIQDVNRFLPASDSGFGNMLDRTRTFEKMISIENSLNKNQGIKGGKIDVKDLLRTGTKSIILSNSSLKAYIDHKHGGRIFELDYLTREANIFAAHDPEINEIPSLFNPLGRTSSFIDHFLPPDCSRLDFMNGINREFADFATAPFEYDIKKDNRAIRAALLGRGVVSFNGNKIPLSLEKVFSLDGDKPYLYFDYTLLNNSLAPTSFKFATEIVFALPGVITNQATLKSGSKVFNRLNWDRGLLEDVDKWSLNDSRNGISVLFNMESKCTVWFFPAVLGKEYQGVSIVITAPAQLEPNEKWSLSGKITLRKIRVRGEDRDVI